MPADPYGVWDYPTDWPEKPSDAERAIALTIRREAYQAGRGSIAPTYAEVLAYVPPPPPRPDNVPEVISDRQFFHALAKMQIISEQEALAAVSTGTIPQAMADIVEAIGVDSERFDAKMFLSGAVEFRRIHPLVSVFGAAMGWSETEIDNLFIFAGSL